MGEIVSARSQTGGYVLAHRIYIYNWLNRHESSMRGMTLKFLGARYTTNPKQIHAL